jgi:starvation-inducible DNA-binding protein
VCRTGENPVLPPANPSLQTRPSQGRLLWLVRPRRCAALCDRGWKPPGFRHQRHRRTKGVKDTFALFLKTNWHVTGPHFRDYHLLFDEQATEILVMTDLIAERVRKIGRGTLRSIGDIARHQRVQDNQRLIASRQQVHNVCAEHGDVASTSLLETFIDAAEKRSWFLYEAGRRRDSSGH